MLNPKKRIRVGVQIYLFLKTHPLEMSKNVTRKQWPACLAQKVDTEKEPPSGFH